MISNILFIVSISIIIYFALLSLWYMVLLIASFPEVINKFREARYGNITQLIERGNLIPATIVTPAFNEEKRILNMLYSGLNSNYKQLKFIVVNDGSTDGTMELLKTEFDLYEVPVTIKQTFKTALVKHCYLSKKVSNLMVLDKEHSPNNCASDAVNAGLNACTTPVMLTVDADTVLEPDAITRMMFALLSQKHCIVVSGSVYILNENKVERGKLLTTNLPKKFISAVQAVEYLRSFLYGRSGLNVLGGALCYPGAFTLFETEALREVGGFDSENFSYDAEIITKLHHYMRQHRYPHKLNHSPNAFCWTEAPSTLKSYWGQRYRWQRGMWRSVMRHFTMFLNPNYGIVGMLTFPGYVLFEVLGPVVEFVSYLTLAIAFFAGVINYSVIFWFLILAWGTLTYTTVAMVFLNLISFNKYDKISDMFRALWLVFAEMLGFRQYRALCCAVGTGRYMFNRLLGRPL